MTFTKIDASYFFQRKEYKTTHSGSNTASRTPSPNYRTIWTHLYILFNISPNWGFRKSVDELYTHLARVSVFFFVNFHVGYVYIDPSHNSSQWTASRLTANLLWWLGLDSFRNGYCIFFLWRRFVFVCSYNNKICNWTTISFVSYFNYFF